MLVHPEFKLTTSRSANCALPTELTGWRLDEDITATAANVISVTKAHFACYGTPDTFLSDNGAQYTSQDFLNFAKTYGLKLITWSPYYARATGKGKAAIKEAKKM